MNEIRLVIVSCNLYLYMHMWNPFKKKQSSQAPSANLPQVNTGAGDKSGVKDKLTGVGMNMMAKIAMKKIAKMSPQEQQKMMQEAFKNKDKMLSVMEQMKASGQITEEQYNMAKKKLGM